MPRGGGSGSPDWKSSRDALAGVISAVLQIAYCISFSALIFQGTIVAGFPLGLAALIM
jgi:SulP family sulfate permease